MSKQDMSNETHKYNTRSNKKKTNMSLTINPPKKTIQTLYNKKNIVSSDDDDSDYDEDEEDDFIDEDEEDDFIDEDEEDDFIVKDSTHKKQEAFDEIAFQQLLADMFPSKFMSDKVEKTHRKRAHSPPISSSTPKKTKNIKQNVDKYIVEETTPTSPSKMTNFNIVFTINPFAKNKNNGSDEDYDMEQREDYDSNDPDYDPYAEEDELMDEEVFEDDTDIEDTEDEDTEVEEYDDEDEEYPDYTNTDSTTRNNFHTELEHYQTAKKYIEDLPESQKSNPVIKKMMSDMKSKETKISKRQAHLNKKQRYNNTLKFRDLLQQKNVMNDLNYFQEKMTFEEQETVLQQMEEIKTHIDIEKPYRLALLGSSIPSRFKASAYNKLSALKNMEPGSGEYNKIRHWVDDFMRIPFNKLNNLPVCIDDGVDKCHDFMEHAKNTLDKAVYGLNDVKLQVMQMVGQWITNPDAIGNAVAIEGPPGTGKTTLVKEGISKILNREFVFIPLGGATDSSCLEGHSYTYEGSTCGLIVKKLIQCQSMNPIIYFDELDKISDTPKGEEIVGILTHLTDTSQNNSFHDKYFAEFEFDLSRCVFFFSYNDRSKVNKILLDRMHCIMTKGYEMPHKAIISKDYLLPTIRKQVKFGDEDIIIPNETIEHIINTHTYKEDGVRNLKRCLEIIHTKLNLYRLMKPGTNLFESDMSINVEFPITVTPHIVDKLIKKHNETGAWQNMYM